MSKRPTEAWRSAALFEDGMGQIVVARFKGSGETEAGVFLLDTYCLGVKNAFFVRVSAHEYETRILGQMFPEGDQLAMTPSCARKLVEDGIAYARRAGIEPHSDYKKAARVFGGIDAAACGESFTFGRDGKPFYVQGPHDSPDYVAHVFRMLRAKLGLTGFHYMVTTGAADEIWPEFADDDLE